MEQQRSRQAERSLWDKIWKDGQGNVVIWQFPNLWLIGWAVLDVASLFMANKSTASDILSWLSSGALIIWSLLEILTGVNYFRRGLGVVVLAGALAIVKQSL